MRRAIGSILVGGSAAALCFTVINAAADDPDPATPMVEQVATTVPAGAKAGAPPEAGPSDLLTPEQVARAEQIALGGKLTAEQVGDASAAVISVAPWTGPDLELVGAVVSLELSRPVDLSSGVPVIDGPGEGEAPDAGERYKIASSKYSVSGVTRILVYVDFATNEVVALAPDRVHDPDAKLSLDPGATPSTVPVEDSE